MPTKLPLPGIRNRPGYHWFVVSTVCVGAFMAALDASITNVALPTLSRHYLVHMRVVEWVSLVYLLTLAAFIVPFSRLSDMLGRRPMYILGFVVFILGSLLCGVAPSFPALLGARGIQGVGAAMLQANSVSIVTAAAPAADRGKAIGIQASAQGIGLSLGPAIGGALITFLDWRWIFFINIPIGIIGTVLGLLLLPVDTRRAVREKFDFLGALFLAPSLVAGIYVLNSGLKAGWTSPVVLFSCAVAIIGMIAFYVTETRVNSPLVDFSLFRKPVFTLGNLSGMLSFAVTYAVMFLIPFLLENVALLTSFESGLYLTMIPIGMTLFTPVSGALADKYGSRMPTVAGMTVTTVGCLLLAVLGVSMNTWVLVSGLFFVGVGMGMFTPPNNSQVMGTAPPHRLGITGGMLNMARTLGMGFGITLGGLAVQLFLYTAGTSERTANKVQLASAFHSALLTVAVVAAVIVGISFLSKRFEHGIA